MTEHRLTEHRPADQQGNGWAAPAQESTSGYFVDPSGTAQDGPPDNRDSDNPYLDHPYSGDPYLSNPYPSNPYSSGPYSPKASTPTRTAIPAASRATWFALLDGALAMIAAVIAGFVVALIGFQSGAGQHIDLFRYLPLTLAVTAVRAPVRVDYLLASDSATPETVHVTGQVGLVFATFVVVVIVLTVRAERNRPQPTWRDVTTSVVARALGAGALGVVLALVGRTTTHPGSIFGSGGLRITPSAVGAFVGAFGFALVVGGLAAVLTQRRRLVPAPRARGVELWIDAAREVRTFALIGGALATVVGVAYLAHHDLLNSTWPAVLIELPMAALGALLLFAGADGHAGVTSSYSYGGGDQAGFGIFAGGSGALFIAALMVPLIAMLTASTGTTLRQPVRTFSWGHSVRTAVVTVAGAAIVVWTMSATVSGSGNSGGLSLGGSGSVHVGFSVFGALAVAAVWGLLLGVLGDPAARLCLRSAPGLARVLAGGRIHPSWSHAGQPSDLTTAWPGAPDSSTPARYADVYRAPSSAVLAHTSFGPGPSASPGLPGPSPFARPDVLDHPSPYPAPAPVVDNEAVGGSDAPDDPFWFAVTRSTDVLEPDGGSRVAYILEPGQWYLALGSAGPGRGGLHVTLDSGLAGILYDVAEIHRAP